MSAHRPTYFAAKARENQGGYKRWLPSTAVSSKALPAHLTLKRRQLGQNSAEELSNRDFRSELEMREKMTSSTTRTLALPTTTTDKEEEDRINNFSDDKLFDPNADDQLLSSSDGEENDNDENDEKNGTDSDSDSDKDDDSDDDDDDDDEEAELERELEKIRRERAEEEMRRRQKQAEEEERENRQQILMGNPLLKPITSRNGIDDENDDEDDQFDDTRSVTSSVSSSTTSYALKRKWNDDTVFKNQAMDEPKIKKRFINDTIRSDFHKKFLEKYIK